MLCTAFQCIRFQFKVSGIWAFSLPVWLLQLSCASNSDIDNSGGLAVSAMWWMINFFFFCFGCSDITLTKLSRTSALHLTLPYIV